MPFFPPSKAAWHPGKSILRFKFFKLYIQYVQIYAVCYTAGVHQCHSELELLHELCYTSRQSCFPCNLQGVLQESGNKGSEDSFQCLLAGILKIILCYTYCLAQLISKLKMCSGVMSFKAVFFIKCRNAFHKVLSIEKKVWIVCIEMGKSNYWNQTNKFWLGYLISSSSLFSNCVTVVRHQTAKECTDVI